MELGHWWIKYSAEGQIFRESSKSERYADAERLLKTRIGEVVAGSFHGLQVEKTTVDQLLDDVLLDYKTNGKAVRFAARRNRTSPPAVLPRASRNSRDNRRPQEVRRFPP